MLGGIADVVDAHCDPKVHEQITYTAPWTQSVITQGGNGCAVDSTMLPYVGNLQMGETLIMYCNGHPCTHLSEVMELEPHHLVYG